MDSPSYIDLDDHIDGLTKFLHNNFHNYPKTRKVRKTSWVKVRRYLNEQGVPLTPSFGKCFISAKFILFYGGGKRYYDLMKISPFIFNSDIDVKTTHWFVRRKSDGKIFDPTSDQFIYDINIKDLYSQAIKADLGRPYWPKRANGKRYDIDVVPANGVMHLADIYKEEHGSAGSFDYWFDERQREMYNVA